MGGLCFSVLARDISACFLAVDGAEYYSWYLDSYIHRPLQLASYDTVFFREQLRTAHWAFNTVNISHLETNAIEQMNSLYILGTAQWLKQLQQPFFFVCFFSQHSFHAIIAIKINIQYTPLNSLKTIDFMKLLFFFPFPYCSLCLVSAWISSIHYVQSVVSLSGYLKLKACPSMSFNEVYVTV